MLTPDQYEVIDGFTLRTRLRCNLTFRSLVLPNYNDLRRAGAFRPRILCVPEDPVNTPIPARDVYEFQLSVQPGSAFWGYSFKAAAGDFSVQVTDACTDVPLFSEPLLSNGDGSRQRPLSRLFVVSEPGIVNVLIANLTAADATGVQFILWGGQPAC